MTSISGSIESLVTDWKLNTLYLSAGSALSFAAARAFPSTLANLALMANLTALGILLASEGARQYKLNRYFRVADIELYAITRFILSKFQKTPQNMSSDKPEILFLHGMLGHGRTGNWILENLKPYASVYQIDMGTDLLSTLDVGYEQEIERCAKLVEKKIQTILEETKKDKITLLCHSRGGVTGNLLATRSSLIGRVITIGTPQKLTLKGGESGKTLQKAAFMNALCEKVKKASGVRFLQFVSQADLITDQDQMLTQNEVDRHIQVKEYDTFGHAGGVLSEAVLKEIIEEIKDG